MKKTLTFIAISGVMSLGVLIGTGQKASAGWWDQEKPEKVAVLAGVDNSALSNPEFEKYKLAMIGRLRQSGEKRGLRTARLEIVSLSSATTQWVGEFSEMGDADRGAQLLKKIARDPVGCAGLKESMKRISGRLDYLERQGFTTIHVLIWSPLVATGIPCNEVDSVSVPQLPIEVNFDAIFQRESLGSLVFMAVDQNQEPQYNNVLSGTAQYLLGKDKTFHLMAEEETVSQIMRKELSWLQKS